MMNKSRKQIRSRWLKKLMHLHLLVTGLSLSAYFSVAFFDPGFLSYDLRQKYHALADNVITVSATVLGAPIKPVVTGVSQCNVNILSVELDWGDDVNTYTYDISRNGLPLVTGISSSGYSDTSVVLGTTYEYIVTAHGPMGTGFATSLPVSVTTLSECGIALLVPVVEIIIIHNLNVSSGDYTPSISELQPLITGTTNIPNVIVHIRLESPVVFLATVIANANGYWEWRPPTELSAGVHTITATAIDPNGVLPPTSDIHQFEIIVAKSHDAGGGSKKKTTTSSSTGATQVSAQQQTPIDFSLLVENNDNTVLQGQDLQAVLKITDVAGQYDGALVPIRYSLIDEKGEVLLSVTRETLLKKGDEIRESLPITLHAVVGEYSLRAEILFDRVNVSRTASLTVKALPLLDLGGGVSITYAGIVRNLGWIALAFLISLLLWLFMFMREYGMYLHAIRHIAEQQLMNAGFITKRKGVIK